MEQGLDESQLFELILKEVGGFGRYQKLLLSLSLFVSIIAACNHLSPIYLNYQPDKYQCIEPTNESITGNLSAVDFKCRFGDKTCAKWQFDTSVFSSTVVTQFDLVCQRSALIPTIASSYMAGVSFEFPAIFKVPYKVFPIGRHYNHHHGKPIRQLWQKNNHHNSIYRSYPCLLHYSLRQQFFHVCRHSILCRRLHTCRLGSIFRADGRNRTGKLSHNVRRCIEFRLEYWLFNHDFNGLFYTRLAAFTIVICSDVHLSHFLLFPGSRISQMADEQRKTRKSLGSASFDGSKKRNSSGKH